MKAAAVWLVAVGFVGCAAAPEAGRVEVPLPPDVRIVPPAVTVPKDVAAFSGKWMGVWVGPRPPEGPGRGGPGRRDHMLVVEEVRATDATVICAWGTGAGLFAADPRPGWVRVTGRFVGDALRVVLPPAGATITYRMRSDGTLDAINERGGFTFRARMTRMTE